MTSSSSSRSVRGRRSLSCYCSIATLTDISNPFGVREGCKVTFSTNPFSRVKNFEFKIYQLRQSARGKPWPKEEKPFLGRKKCAGGGPTISGREPAPPRATEHSSNRSPPHRTEAGEKNLLLLYPRSGSPLETSLSFRYGFQSFLSHCPPL